MEKYYTDTLDIPNSTVLITGGASGIGLGLAQCFLREGANVILIDRSIEQLNKSIEQLNEQFDQKKIFFHFFDLEKCEERENLFQWIIKEHPQTNILINNAAIQLRQSFLNQINWNEQQKQIEINLSAPIHLSNLFLQHFKQINRLTSIINVTSDLAFLPLTRLPIYSATKSALHSFTMSLRLQLQEQFPSIQIYEIIPPPIQTNLGGQHPFGHPVHIFTQSVMQQLINGKQNITFQQSDVIAKLVYTDQIHQQFINFHQQTKTLPFLN